MREMLSAADVRALFLLTGELVELGETPDAWRQHLAAALAQQLGARIAVVNELRFTHASGENLMALHCGHFVDQVHEQLTGLSPTERAPFREAVFCVPHHEDPTFAKKAPLYGRSFTVARSALISAQAWYRSTVANDRFRVHDCDDYVESHAVLRNDVVSSIGIYRGWRERGFSPRQRLFVQLLHDELARRWAHADGPHLSRRERETLAGLRRGQSEKELAATLGIATSTAHDYVKAVYRKLAVRSRGELHAKLAARIAPALVSPR